MCLWLFLLFQDLCGIVEEKPVMGKGALTALTILEDYVVTPKAVLGP